MKIGILTFHWASNYGAVLQAYALQEHLRQAGHAVEIINYQPVRVIVRLKLGRVRERAIFEKADSTRLSQEPCFGVCTYSKRPGRLAK